MPFLGKANSDPFPGVTIMLGSSGATVKKIQTRLKALGYFSGTINGSYLASTITGVTGYQKKLGLSGSGKVDLTTWNALFNNNSAYSKYPYPNQVYKAGSSGANVKLIQTALKGLGRYSGAIDGSFGGGTTTAVKAFQAGTKFLGVDGMVGPNTWGELFRLFEEAKAAPVVPKVVPPPTPAPAPPPTPAKARPDALLERLGKDDGESANPLVPWYKPTGVPPAYHDDNLPTHRVQQGAYFLRIGDCQFFIPPLFIRVNNATPTKRVPTLRQRESISVNSGYSNRDIEISLWFNDLEQINGLEVANGPDGETYYMDGLRSLISQFKKTPFLPIVNEMLNGIHNIYAVTLLTITANTVPDLPGCIQVKLTMKEFNAQPFIGVPTPALDMMYCWPLFRWFYQQPLLEGKNLSKYKYPKISTNELTGQIRFRILPEFLLAMLKPNVSNKDNKYQQYEYLDDEWAFMEEVPMAYDDFIVNDISISIGNIVTDLQLAHYASPTHQFMGSLDTMVTLNITTQSKQIATDMVKMQELVQRYSRQYKNKIATGYIGVENELINMYGVDMVTIQNLDISTVEGQPDLISIRMDLLSYNKTQKEQEKAGGMAPHRVIDEQTLMIGKSTEDYKNPIITDGVIEDMINELELYPDLELPNYTVVREVIDKLNTNRTAKGYANLGITSAEFECPYSKVSEIITKEASTTTSRRPIVNWPGATFKVGNSGSNVALINKALIKKGYSVQNDSNFSAKTLQAVNSVKSKCHLIETNVQRETWNAIINMNVDPRVAYPGDLLLATFKNSSGSSVTALTTALKTLGFASSVSSSYSSSVKASVVKFQTSTKFLQADGIVGYNTWGELFTRVLEATVPAVTESKTVDNSFFVDPDFYIFYPAPLALGLMDSSVFDDTLSAIREGGGSGMLDKSIKTGGEGATQYHSMMKMLNKANLYRADYGVKVTAALKEETQDMPNVKDDEFYKLMMHDAFAHSRRYSMVRAFPTSLLLFVDEGQRVRGIRLWSNYYAYHSLISIAVTRDKDNPIDVCELVISNIYRSLSTKPTYTTHDKKNLWDTWFLKVDKEMIEARKKLYSFMSLETGTRIHVRMGYGSAPQGLPIMFNGTIANMDHDEVITIIAQSDGGELISPIADIKKDDNNGMFKFGAEPSNIIRTLMSARDGFQAAFTWNKGLTGKGEFGGFSNQSKYGIEHFGYVFAMDGLDKDLAALFHAGTEGKWCYDQVKNVYKGPPFIADYGKYRRTTLNTPKFFDGTDEDNIYMYLYGKSPWDIFKTVAAAAPDYICTSSPHGFRSTLFFGQPQWLYKYGFTYVGGPVVAERKDLKNYYELVKSYQQLHFIDSVSDIIDNGIQANSIGVITAVIPVYTEGESTKSDLLMFADKNIYPECQKTAYYDTTMMQDMWLPEWLLTGIPGTAFEWAKQRARMMGVSYLQHSFKDMYKGEIVILGDGSIKPYDMLFLTDTHREIFGPCEVGTITTSMSLENGFITTIKPDLITTTQFQESVPVTRAIAAAQLFSFNVFTARSAIITGATVEKATAAFHERNTKTENVKNILGVIEGVATAAIVGSFFLGPAGIPSAAFAFLAWTIVDKSIEWAMNVFSGRDNNTIAAIPLMHRDRPLIAGMKGHQTLIPGYYDEDIGEEPNLVQTEGVSPETMETIVRLHQEDWNKIIEGHNVRQKSGVDIFALSPAAKMEWDLARSFGGGGGTGAVRGKILAEALRIINLKPKTKYLWGATGETVGGIFQADCSGYTTFIFNKVGIPIGARTAQTQYDICKKSGKVWTSQAECKGGDLVFFAKSKGAEFHHVAIFVSPDIIYEAASANSGIKIGSIKAHSSQSPIIAYGRTEGLVKDDASGGTGKQTALTTGPGIIQAITGANKAGFIAAISVYAVKKYKSTGLWASLIIACSAQESTWGQSPVAKGGKNLFGIKGYPGVWKGKTFGHAPQAEDPKIPGGCPYKAYDSYDASIDDFVNLIEGADRYAPIRNAANANAACLFYQTGYAGDSTKDTQLRSIMKTNNLVALYDK